VQGRAVDRKKPATPEAGRAALLALVEQMTGRLTVKLTAHRQRQAFLASMQSDLLAFDNSRDGELMRRYQLAKGRELDRLLATYFKLRSQAAAGADREPPLIRCTGLLDDTLSVGVEVPVDQRSDTTPDPRGSLMESLLQRVDPAPIRPEVWIPTIQAPTSDLPADSAVVPVGETKPDAPATPVGETNPTVVDEPAGKTNPNSPPDLADKTNPNRVEGPVTAATRPRMAEYVAAKLAQLDPSERAAARFRKILQALEPRSVS
jgi:hypothetical protein